MNRHPKRRKSKDNPYKIYICNNKYLIKFRSNDNSIKEFEIAKEIYDAFDRFELEDISQMHKDDNHKDLCSYDYSEIVDNYIFNNSIYECKSVETIVENKILNEKLKFAINQLSEVQKRRIIMYYFDGLTQQEIANREQTSLRAIQYTLNMSISKLKEILKNLKN